MSPPLVLSYSSGEPVSSFFKIPIDSSEVVNYNSIINHRFTTWKERYKWLRCRERQSAFRRNWKMQFTNCGRVKNIANAHSLRFCVWWFAEVWTPSRRKGRGEGMDTEKNKEAPRDGTSLNIIPANPSMERWVQTWNYMWECDHIARRRRFWSNLRDTLVTMTGVLSVLTLFIYIWVCLFRWVI